MVNLCCILNCPSRKTGNRKKYSLFSIPKDERISNEWKQAISKVNGKPASLASHVCELHFGPNDICRSFSVWNHGTVDVSDFCINKKKPKLNHNVIPTIFDEILNEQQLTDIKTEDLNKFKKGDSHLERKAKLDSNVHSSTVLFSEVSNPVIFHEEPVPNCRKKLIWPEETRNQLLPGINFGDECMIYSFNELLKNLKFVKLPLGWNYIHDQIAVTYFLIKHENVNEIKAVIYKQIVISSELTIHFYVNDKLLKLENLKMINLVYPLNALSIERAVIAFSDLNICVGGPNSTNFPGIKDNNAELSSNKVWHQLDCPYIIPSGKKRSLNCEKLLGKFRLKKLKIISGKITKKYISPTLTPIRRKMYSDILLHKVTLAKTNKRYLLWIQNLHNKLSTSQNTIKDISTDSINNIANGLNEPQKNIVQEIHKASLVKNPKNRKYSENWILLCILFHIRSPAAYKFLMQQKILPLPCPRTIRRYLSLVKSPCGFDEDFFRLFKKKVSFLSKNQKHGMLVFDEIMLRESVCVNSTTLTYMGLENFGNELLPKNDTNTKANYGLVFAFQSLSANFFQPIGVFLSKGSVTGIVLAQLVLKAISLLEAAGTQIDGVVSDGAQTNRRMWSEFGVSGDLNNLQNYTIHPMNPTRKLFFFSDAPHLIKNVRNKLHDKKLLRVSPNQHPINWNFYNVVHKLDQSQSPLVPTRACPKITQRHLKLDNFSKMTVKFATQVLSNSMAKAIHFYREHQHIEELKHSEETEKFTCIFNSVFDALNRRYPAEGIRSSSSKDIQVLEETISWLNDWESHVIKGNIKKDEFLTNSTANGLRVTMKSTIDLSNYLLQTCGFKYVLTNKMNQDRMEQFFGTTRQSIGPNDHPTCPSFLQVYKLLTVYSIIKPPKTGNCQILDPSTSMIQLSDLKDLFKSEPSERQIKIERLKRLLDSMVEESDWNSNVDLAFQDHSYSTKIKVAAKECVLYYICGYVSKQIQKHTKCNVCLSAFKGTDRDALLHEAALTNLKSKGYLLYPNKQFFKLITAIEEGFVKFAQDPEVFNKTVDYVIIEHYNLLTFPCKIHKTEIMTTIFQYYITMRMKQFTLVQNKEVKQKSFKKKKLSKLVST